MTKLFRFLRPSYQHSALSATLLLMGTVMLSRVIGYVREAYIAYAFGAGMQTDAYVAAFTLPDWLNYIVAGGAASITFISIYTRFLAEKRDADAQKTFSIVITVMSAVMIVGTIITEIFTPQFVRWMFHGFSPTQVELTVNLTRILLPAQIFFYVGGVVSAVLLSHRLFLFPAFGPLIYNLLIIAGGALGGRRYGIAALAYGALAGAIAGPFLASVLGAVRIGTGYRPSFDVSSPAFREWVKLSIPLMLGVSLVTADDWILRHYAASGVGDIANEIAAKKVARVYDIESAKLEPYTPDGFVAALKSFIRQKQPKLVLMPHTYQVRDFAPKLAAALNRALISDAVGYKYEGGKLLFTRQMFQGKFAADVSFVGEAPYFATFQNGAFRGDQVQQGDAAAPVETVSVEIGDNILRNKPEAPFKEAKQAVDLTQAAIIVAVGRGIKEQKNIDLARQLADALGGEIAASRPICDSSWLPMDRQVGSSGQTVAPKLYLALGISGAIQHVVGMKGARTIIAINKDSEAPIFEIADIAVVGNLFEIVPPLVEEVKKAKSA